MALVDDKNLFVEEEKITKAGNNLAEEKTEVVQDPPKAKEPEHVSESSVPMPPPLKEPEPASSSSVMPPPLMAAPEAAAADPFGTPKSPGGDDNDGWANSDFFTDDPFASSSPFGAASPGNGGEDAFGFPTPKKSTTKKAKTTNVNSERIDNDAFFTSGADSWGEPSAMLPVDFTPRKTNAHYFEDHDQSDTISYDATETSEITNPTFASASVMNTTINSRPDPEGDKTVNKSNASDPFDDVNKSTASDPVSDSEGTATTPVDGKESLARKYKQKKAASKRLPPTNTASDKRNVAKEGNTSVDPPLALDTMESSEDERDDNNQGRTPATQPVVARSRILSKYAKGRRQANLANNTSLGTIHSLDSNDKNEISTMSSGRSVGSTEQRSIGSRSIGSAGQRSIVSSGANTSAKKLALQPPSADSTPVRKGGEAAGSRASPAGNVINPATMSSSSRRGRMSPIRSLSTSGNVGPTKPMSPESNARGSPKRANKYGSVNRKKKVSPSVVDNPAYYSVSTI